MPGSIGFGGFDDGGGDGGREFAGTCAVAVDGRLGEVEELGFDRKGGIRSAES